MANAATKLRYVIGKSCSQMLDTAVAIGIVPFGSHFPVGYHFELDLRRFKGTPITTIIDAGANKGDTALRFARFFSGATVHAFEPVAATCDVLCKRVASQRRIRVHQEALGNHAGELTIRLHANS